MRGRFRLPQSTDAKLLQGLASLREGQEYTVLEVFTQHGNGSKFRIEVSEHDVALFDSRAFVVTSHTLPPNWGFFQLETGSFSLCPEAWNQFGFWEDFYEREPNAVDVYEQEKRKILSSC